MKKIELHGKYGTGKFALVDDEDYELVNQYRWRINAYGYAETKVKKKSIYMHRLIMDAKKGKEVDHINHDKLDNQKSNLRICTRQQNGHNQRPQKNGSSQYKGVSYLKTSKKWQAQITHNNEKIYIGVYKTESQAALAYNAKAKNLFGKFALLNEIYCDCENPNIKKLSSCSTLVCSVCRFEAKPAPM